MADPTQTSTAGSSVFRESKSKLNEQARVCDARIKLTSPETSRAKLLEKKRLLSLSLPSVLVPSAIYAVLIKYKGNARAEHDAGSAFTFTTTHLFASKLIFPSNFHRH